MLEQQRAHEAMALRARVNEHLQTLTSSFTTLVDLAKVSVYYSEWSGVVCDFIGYYTWLTRWP